MPDEYIDYSDIPEVSDEWFENATLVWPNGKRQLTVRIDSDVLDWFRAGGKGYQSRMNAVLRGWVEAQKAKQRKGA